MTGKMNKDLSSVLPLNARCARIAADGGLVASLREAPAEGNKAQGGYHVPGTDPDGLDLIMPQAADSRMETAFSVPGRSVLPSPYPDENPT